MGQPLESEIAQPSMLQPKEKMGRNEPCWCRSGVKWKNCHRDRESQKPPPLGQVMHATQKTQQCGYCLHPLADQTSCSEKPIKSHTIQRNGGLSSIAEGGHVISGKRGYNEILKNEGELVPKLVGISSASTFMGFCGEHDNKLFEPIERSGFRLDQEAAFLLAYRAISFEYLAKQNSIDAINIQRKLDMGKPFESQVELQQFLWDFEVGVQNGLKDLKYWKRLYDERLLDRNYGGFHHYAVQLAGDLPIVTCGGFLPEVSLDGHQIQFLTGTSVEVEHVCLTVSVLDGRTFIVLAWMGREDGPGERFARSFQEVPPLDKANMSLHLAAEHLENTYFRPSWWFGLEKSVRDHLVKRMRSGTLASPERPTNTFLGVQKILPEQAVVDEILPEGWRS